MKLIQFLWKTQMAKWLFLKVLDIPPQPSQNGYHQEIWQPMLERMWRKRKPYSVLLGVQVITAIVEVNWRVFKKIIHFLLTYKRMCKNLRKRSLKHGISEEHPSTYFQVCGTQASKSKGVCWALYSDLLSPNITYSLLQILTQCQTVSQNLPASSEVSLLWS